MPAIVGFRDGRHTKQVVVVTREPEGVAGRYSRGIVQAPLENPPQVGAVHLGLSTVLRKTRLQTRLFCSNFVFNRIFIAIRG